MSRSTIRFSTKTPTPTGEGAHFSPDTNARQRKVRFGGLFYCLREAQRLNTRNSNEATKQTPPTEAGARTNVSGLCEVEWCLCL